MAITLNFSMVKYGNSRKAKYNYTMKSITTKLDRLGWDHVVIPPATMILHFSKTFETKEAAIAGRKEMETSLLPVSARFDGFTES